jgi:hypothetical protein
MSAINYLNSISTALLAIVSGGGALMALAYSVKKSMAQDEDEAVRAGRNCTKVIKGVILGVTVTGLIKTIFTIIS